jgi:PIN domain nuclease of toxin-antitoxin system
VTPAPVLDTHAWVWWVDQDARLSRAARARLDELPQDERPYVCDISLWEIATLVELGRLSFDLPLGEWFDAAAHPRSVRIVGITPQIAAEVASLPPGLHRDPADRLIVATARVLKAPVLTQDRRILKSRLVTPWRP